jgi:hypothetical protein
MKLSYA